AAVLCARTDPAPAAVRSAQAAPAPNVRRDIGVGPVAAIASSLIGALPCGLRGVRHGPLSYNGVYSGIPEATRLLPHRAAGTVPHRFGARRSCAMLSSKSIAR